MASNKRHQTLGDYLAIAISPALIMALVGSLVFFLLEVLYAGKYEGRLQWILFFFVFATVLIARITMRDDIAPRAGLYGLVLAALVYVGLQLYVEYPPDSPLAGFRWAVNFGLMAVIWWCAHRLTWDCTLIDDTVDASGEGLMQASGLSEEAKIEDRGSKIEKREVAEAVASTRDPRSSILDPRSSGFFAWLDRYQRYRAERLKKPHNPGVWVVYFSLAALPLFGLGQSLIPVEDGARRRYAFWLMGIYMGSGLGLLLATCYLGLRRYLRQRKLQMPKAMTGLWLVIGGALVVVLLAAGALLPRPSAEYRLVDVNKWVGSPDRGASRMAVKGDSGTKGEGRGGSGKSSADQKNKNGSGDQRDQQGGQAKGKSGSGRNQQGKGQSQQQKDQSSGEKSSKDGSKQQSSGSGRDDKETEKEKVQKSSGSESGAASARRFRGLSELLPSRLGWLGSLLKWVVFAIVAVAVVIVLLRSGLKWLANFTDWARRLLAALEAWWQALFGWRARGDRQAEEVGSPAAVKRPRPFASFRNPFLDGASNQRSPEELVRYSFEALQALAAERGVGRNPDETPLEFAGRLGEDLPAIESEAQQLVALYARAAYGGGRLPPSCLGTVRQFWQCLEGVAESPVSA